MSFFAQRRVCAAASVLLVSLLSDAMPARASTPLRYDVQIARDGHADVQLCVAPARQRIEFSVDALRSAAVLADVRRVDGGDLRARGARWTADDWHTGDCLRYTADLATLSAAHSEAGSSYGDALVSDPTYWLMRTDLGDDTGAEITVHEPEDRLLSVPWHRVARDGHEARYRIPDTPRSWSGSVVLGRIAERDIALGEATVRVALLEGEAADDASELKMLDDWLGTPARSIESVTGQFPVPEVRILVIPVSQLSLPFRFGAWLRPSAVFGGESARGQGNSLELVIDPHRPTAEFLRDWTAFHELGHLMHPYLGDRGSWLSEGLATYYQNVLRARAGRLSALQAWQRMGEGFTEIEGVVPGGTLEDVAARMGETGQFNYVYRSGELFWLSADVELRRRSAGKLTLDSALAAFRACCLPSYREWRPEDFVQQLDRSLGVDLFATRFREARAQTRFADWRTLYQTLGIEMHGESFTLGASARDAATRDAIMRSR